MDKDLRLDQKTRMYIQNARYLALAAAISISCGANAQLLHNVTIGNPKALALGNAVTADPPGIDSIHFNPAGLAKIKGRQMNIKILAAHMTLDAEFGEPTRPDSDYKQLYYNLVQNNPDICPDANNADECWGTDPIANTSSSSDGPSLMLPFFGMTEIPILAFPSGGIAFEDSARGWTFGTAVYSPQGIGYRREDGDPAASVNPGDPGGYQGVGVGVTRLTYFSPTVAIPVSETLSFGVGINFSYQGLAMDTYIRAPLETTRWLETINEILPDEDALHILRPYDTVGRLSVEMEDFLSVGFNFGILYEPYEWLSFGFLYQSETTSQLSGDYKMENTESFIHTAEGLGTFELLLPLFDGTGFHATPIEEGTVELEYIMPQNIAFGTSVKVLPNLKINFDVRWVEYSVWDELEFEFSDSVDFLNLSSVIYSVSGLKDNADPDAMRIRRAYEDTWSIAIGAEYQLNDNVVLRAGYEPREGAIPSTSADLLFPIGDADLFTAGFGWQMSSTTRIDAAFGVLYSEQNIAACESKNANSCQEGDVVYNPYYSMPFKTETIAYIGALSFDKKF
ncbi:OmpP1/FadL family transporter [Ketobacter alkanivorans]|uniref:Aromatic hydrocarbon degradation protein n=1 Tax=Ketobacter alkanivorans TaxID=1917421 RepID=A0A2K9LG23_9GAMM|nr:outer membrane protein transport protein [Ketobacter alkanivorans]AUM11298.1 hypothetical protein Kalk_02135 [Ketobacter alkanivorans]